MSFIKIGLISSIFFITSFTSAFAVCYDLSGAGSTAANGTYEDTGTAYNGYPSYFNGTMYLFKFAGNSYWMLNTVVDSSSGYYYYLSTPEFPSPIGGYDTIGAGAGGWPTAVLGDCEEEATTTPSTTASSTFIENLGDVTFGLAIIITLMSLGLIGFVYNTFNKRKKPWQ